MPRGDGTGPFGTGPFTRRGRRQCRGFFSVVGKSNTKKAGIAGALVPLVGSVIRDLVNPNGLIRLVSRKLLGFRKPDQIKNVVEADYVVIDKNKQKD